MLINDQKIQEINQLLDKIEIDKNKNESSCRKMESLQIKIRQMSKHSKSVQRSGNEKRIETFNKQYVQALSELSRLIQTTGQSNRDDSAKLVREIKSK
jgi:superfamily II RNA helicase